MLFSWVLSILKRSAFQCCNLLQICKAVRFESELIRVIGTVPNKVIPELKGNHYYLQTDRMILELGGEIVPLLLGEI